MREVKSQGKLIRTFNKSKTSTTIAAYKAAVAALGELLVVSFQSLYKAPIFF
jgi:hypothetical protein